jgi:hypothetical protein
MKKVEVLGFLLLVVIVLILFRSKSLADPVSPGPGPSPAPAGLLVGAILSKQPTETCATKYGANWTEVTPTLCAKTS